MNFLNVDHYEYTLTHEIVDQMCVEDFVDFIMGDMLTFDVCSILIECDPVVYSVDSVTKKFMGYGRVGEWALRFHASQEVVQADRINTVRKFFHVLVGAQTEVLNEDIGDLGGSEGD